MFYDTYNYYRKYFKPCMYSYRNPYRSIEVFGIFRSSEKLCFGVTDTDFIAIDQCLFIVWTLCENRMVNLWMVNLWMGKLTGNEYWGHAENLPFVSIQESTEQHSIHKSHICRWRQKVRLESQCETWSLAFPGPNYGITTRGLVILVWWFMPLRGKVPRGSAVPWRGCALMYLLTSKLPCLWY